MKRIFFLLALLVQFAYGQNTGSIKLQRGVGGIPLKHTLNAGTSFIRVNNIVTNPANGNTNGIFTYTIPSTGKRSSAGVYDASNNLIRTLWGNRPETPETTVSAQWDGLKDDGATAPTGSYSVKVLTDSVMYDWQYGIGNTTNRGNILKSYGGITGLASSGNKVYFSQGFYEGESTSRVFGTSDIQNVGYVDVGIGALGIDNCTDGVYDYWLCSDQYNPGDNTNATNYIYATKATDNTQVNFSGATLHAAGRPHTSASVVGFYQSALANQYSGIAAQKGSSGYFFASRPDANAIYTFSKATGAIVQTFSVTQPGKMAAGSANELWAIVAGSLKKYNVASNGTLTDAGVSTTSITPVSLAISPDNSSLLVTDRVTRTIKKISNSNGSVISTFGQTGGYTGNPTVTTDRFSFYRDFANPAICYQDDGSFWFNDAGNYRLMHFSGSNAYIEQIAYVPSCRSVNADPNNPASVFIDELEFQVDYSKPLDNGANGSWKLVNNWKEGTVLDGFKKFTQVITFPNGKKYATGSLNNRLYWLSPAGSVDVGALPDGSTLQADGSLYQRVNYGNNYLLVQKAVLTGYSNNMPTWGSFATVATTPQFNSQQPYFYINATNVKGSSTNPNKEFFFNPWKGTIAGASVGYGYHFGAINLGGNSWNFQTAKSTFPEYQGDFPRNGDWDTGNNNFGDGGQHSENSQALVQGSDVFWNDYGEFWKDGGEINVWNHFNQDGLLIGNFGPTYLQAELNGQFGMAGNAYATALVKVGNDYYIWHCDENRWGFAHRWHVSGLSSIQESTVATLNVTASPITKLAEAGKLLSVLPFRAASLIGVTGLQIDTTLATYTGQKMVDMRTNYAQYQKDSTDIYLSSRYNTIGTIPLNNTGSMAGWKITGGLTFTVNCEPTIPGGTNFNYLQILDGQKRVIARFQEYADTYNSYYRYLKLNGINLFTGISGSTRALQIGYATFAFTYTGSALNFSLSSFGSASVTTPLDGTADITSPAYLQINQGANGSQQHTMDLYKLRFSGTAGLPQ